LWLANALPLTAKRGRLCHKKRHPPASFDLENILPKLAHIFVHLAQGDPVASYRFLRPYCRWLASSPQAAGVFFKAINLFAVILPVPQNCGTSTMASQAFICHLA
jgi:hypothetical protein